MKFLMMGLPGCGKGTIGEMLAERLRIPLLSVGQILRELDPASRWYNEIHTAMVEGRLAPNKETGYILAEEVKKPKYSEGFVLDGWGRQITDLQIFDPGFDKVIYLNISPETTIERISNRRTCEKCGRVYNLVTIPPKVEGTCDVCGGRLLQREDETEEAMKIRIETYNRLTAPVIEQFRKSGNLLDINAEPMPDIVFKSILTALGIHDIP